jgi:hypothetical protein
VLLTLLKFVTIGENEPTRRRVQRSTLTDAQRRVAGAFIAARLLISHGDGDDAILEVAHEALFRSWDTASASHRGIADQLRWRADLERWARDWENSGRQDAYLLRDERLKAAQRWAASDGEVVDGLTLVAEFLASSTQADRATMQRLSETIARQALAAVDRDPGYRSDDRTVRIWNAESGAEIIIAGAHVGGVEGVSWSPDGRRVSSASRDGTCRIWDAAISIEDLVANAHCRVSRELTAEERRNLMLPPTG